MENGAAPDSLIGTQNLGAGAVRTRKICKYPDEAVCSGSPDDHASFHCVTHAQVHEDLAACMVSAPRYRQAP